MSHEIISYNEYMAGWLESSVHHFLGFLGRSSANMRYALLTCVDSDRNPAALLNKSPELKPIADKSRPLGNGLLLPTSALIAADARRRILFGFDEIWFFPTDQIKEKPAAASLVGPRRVDQAKLDVLGEWLSNSTCSLALGDGEGLNFIVKAKGLVRYLLAHSREQTGELVGSDSA